jgi:hypothetical protein
MSDAAAAPAAAATAAAAAVSLLPKFPFGVAANVVHAFPEDQAQFERVWALVYGVLTDGARTALLGLASHTAHMALTTMTREPPSGYLPAHDIKMAVTDMFVVFPVTVGGILYVTCATLSFKRLQDGTVGLLWAPGHGDRAAQYYLEQLLRKSFEAGEALAALPSDHTGLSLYTPLDVGTLAGLADPVSAASAEAAEAARSEEELRQRLRWMLVLTDKRALEYDCIETCIQVLRCCHSGGQVVARRLADAGFVRAAAESAHRLWGTPAALLCAVLEHRLRAASPREVLPTQDVWESALAKHASPERQYKIVEDLLFGVAAAIVAL